MGSTDVMMEFPLWEHARDCLSPVIIPVCTYLEHAARCIPALLLVVQQAFTLKFQFMLNGFNKVFQSSLVVVFSIMVTVITLISNTEIV